MADTKWPAEERRLQKGFSRTCLLTWGGRKETKNLKKNGLNDVTNYHPNFKTKWMRKLPISCHTHADSVWIKTVTAESRVLRPSGQKYNTLLQPYKREDILKQRIKSAKDKRTKQNEIPFSVKKKKRWYKHSECIANLCNRKIQTENILISEEKGTWP